VRACWDQIMRGVGGCRLEQRLEQGGGGLVRPGQKFGSSRGDFEQDPWGDRRSLGRFRSNSWAGARGRMVARSRWFFWGGGDGRYPEGEGDSRPSDAFLQRARRCGLRCSRGMCSR